MCCAARLVAMACGCEAGVCRVAEVSSPTPCARAWQGFATKAAVEAGESVPLTDVFVKGSDTGLSTTITQAFRIAFASEDDLKCVVLVLSLLRPGALPPPPPLPPTPTHAELLGQFSLSHAACA